MPSEAVLEGGARREISIKNPGPRDGRSDRDRCSTNSNVVASTQWASSKTKSTGLVFGERGQLERQAHSRVWARCCWGVSAKGP